MYDPDMNNPPSSEKVGSSPQRAPELTAPEPGRGKKTAVTVVILMAIFIAICVITSMAISAIRAANQSPVWRTIEAVLPGGHMVDTLLHVGGDLSVEGTVGERLLTGGDEGDTLSFAAQLLYNASGEFYLSADLWSRSDVIADASLLFCADGMEVASETFLGGSDGSGTSLVLPFKGLTARLEKSIFAPDSGSDYALDEETFAALLDMARFYDPTVAEVETDTAGQTGHTVTTAEVKRILTQAFRRITRAAEGKLEKTEEKRSVTLIDGHATATVYTYTFDKTYILALAEATLDEWEKNEELEQLVRRYLRSAVENTEGLEPATEEDISAAVDSTYEMYTEALNHLYLTLSETCEQDSPSCRLEVAIRSNYLVGVWCTLELNGRAAEDVGGDHPYTGAVLELIFAANPAKNPTFDLVLDSYKAGISTHTVQITQDESVSSTASTRTLRFLNLSYDDSGKPLREERVTLAFAQRMTGAYTFSVTKDGTQARNGVISEADRQVTASLVAGGMCYLDDYNLSLTLTSLEISEAGKEPVVYTKDDLNISLIIRAGIPTLPKLSSDAKDPTQMTAAEMDALLAQAEEAYTKFCQDFKDATGIDISVP